MKKIYSLLLVALLWISSLVAQTPANRTANTIIVDVLAQTPAQNEAAGIQQQNDLLSTGENGLVQLIKMLEIPDERRVKVEFALSGLTHFVTAPEMEAHRLTLVKAYLNTIDLLKNKNAQAFIIRQLEIAGQDEAVDKLASFLDDDALSSPAAGALVAIRSPASGQALLNALNRPLNNQQKENVIRAIGDLQVPGSENALKTLAGEPSLQRAVWYALSRTGSVASLPDLAAAAKKVHYEDEATGATAACLTLINRLLRQGAVKEADRAAADVWKRAGKAGQMHVRAAALQIRMAANPTKVVGYVRDALKDKNRDYRNAVLEYALDYDVAALGKALAASLKKADAERKADILLWFTKVINNPDATPQPGNAYTPVFIAQIADKDREVKKAAAFLLAKSGDDRAIRALIDLLNSPDENDVALAQQTLSFTKGNIAPLIAPYLRSQARYGEIQTVRGKIAILELLAARKADKQAPAVFEQLNAPEPEVRFAAYAALKEVVSVKDLPFLYEQLEKSDPSAAPALQQAIVAALQELPGEKQFENISSQLHKTDKQPLYYPLLAASGDSRALEWITNRFESGTAPEQDAAFQALLDWPDIQVAGQLQTICMDAAAATRFDRALQRYIQLASDPALTGENRRIFLNNALEIAKTDAQKNEILNHLGQTNSYLGLLRAGDYLDQPALRQQAANAVMNIALDNKQYTGKNVRALLEKIIPLLDNPDASYQREALHKHLREMPDENGFTAIFNGNDLAGWKGLVENPIARARMKPKELADKQAKADEIARKHWIPSNGVLLFDGTGGDNLCTEKQYGDFEMIIDWKLEPSPDADAGIYLRGSPQVQIWNIARTDVGAQVGSGGLYNNQINPSIPLKVADNRLGEWNTFYIKMTGDRVTVRLNGELVVDNVILENFWNRAQPIFPTGQIELQAHGSKVYYRNILVKELERPEPFKLSAEEQKEGYRILFDGTNMHEWTGNTVDYILEDGCISMHPSKSHGGNLYTRSEFANFTFRFEFQLTPGANNGLGIRTPMEGDAAYVGMELQILDNDDPIYNDLAPYQYHGSVYGIIPARRGFLKPVGEWNYQEVLADGDHIKITLNGTVIVDGNIREATNSGTPDKQNHPGLFNEKGHIGFLGHGSPVKFRNIRIREWK
ncbi:MAG: DUF1080 domain-containing protein [Prevotellaceae bacterium]|jgi:hypothetical protein|nr:DUF1080 domain-containing protein [Prevotellaceae bacterium]